MSQIIFSTKLKGYQPVIWFGKPVYEHAAQIKSLLKDHLGEHFAELLSDPHINSEAKRGVGKAHWMSAFLDRNAKPFKNLSAEKQEQIRTKLAEQIQQIEAFAKRLETAEDDTLQEFSGLLPQSLEIPGEEYIFVDSKDQITLACWGFTSSQAEKQGFKLSKILPAVKPINLYNGEEPLKEQEFVKSIEQAKSTKPETTNTTINEEQPKAIHTNKKKRKFNWMWLLIVLAIITAAFIGYHLATNIKTPKIVIYIPDTPGKLKPIDPEKIIPNPDDPYKRRIVSNRLNIVVTKETDVEEFNKAFTNAHKDDAINIAYYDTLIRYIQLEVPDNKRAEYKKSLKQQHPEIKLVWDEAVFSHSIVPNDPAFEKDHYKWGLDSIGVMDAWDKTMGDSNIVVAIVDDGFDLTHPEFAKNVVNPWNVPDHSVYVNTGKKNMYHGTHVASTAVGNVNNETGLCGIAPKCKLMPIQVADSAGNISFTSVICGILYAIVKEADVINVSLGMNVTEEMKSLPVEKQKNLIGQIYPDEADFWKDLFTYTDENNITVVIAAGNSNILSGIDPMHRSENIIIVAAVDTLTEKASFSNFGDYTTVSAPGVQIYNAVPDNKYDYLDGTSMASPIVTGAAALIKSIHKDISNKELKEILVSTAKQVHPKHRKGNIGPMIQIDDALEQAMKQFPDTLIISNRDSL